MLEVNLIRSNDGYFWVKILKELIDKRILGENGNIETSWNRLVPRKIFVFIWRLSHYRLPIQKVFDDMGIDLHSTLCPCCNDAVETIDHCFIGCVKVKSLWEKIFAWWGLGQYNIGSTKDLIIFFFEL